MEPLHAPWRIEYILAPKAEDAEIFLSESPRRVTTRCELRHRARSDVLRLLNAYPYTGGHLMVVPYKQAADLHGAHG